MNLKTWHRRLLRFWLVVLLPGSIFCGYQVYHFNDSAKDLHKLGNKFVEQENHEEAKIMYETSYQCEGTAKKYAVAGFIVFILPILAFVSEKLYYFVIFGKFGQKNTHP